MGGGPYYKLHRAFVLKPGSTEICGADEFCGVMTGDVTLVFPNIDAARNNISAVITSVPHAFA